MGARLEEIPRVELEFFSGTTPPLKFTVRDTAGQTVNLTGSTVTITALAGQFEGSAVLWSHVAPPADQSVEEGVARYTLTAGDTAWVPPSTARLQLHYFLVRVVKGAENRVVLCGTIGILRGEA